VSLQQKQEQQDDQWDQFLIQKAWQSVWSKCSEHASLVNQCCVQRSLSRPDRLSNHPSMPNADPRYRPAWPTQSSQPHIVSTDSNRHQASILAPQQLETKTLPLVALGSGTVCYQALLCVTHCHSSVENLKHFYLDSLTPVF